MGVEVYYVAFSPCEISVPDHLPKDILYKELPVALKILGVTDANIITFQYPVRHFTTHRQSILEDLIKLRSKINPDLVMLPNSHDIHQDHKVIHEEGIRAFKHTRIIGYELPWNNLEVINNFHVEVKEQHLESKIQAIKSYKSQNFRTYSSREFFYGLATVRGLQINKKYAESFELIRWIA
jgi:LmbE family N-acetylglucosaminyl deacetylase